MTNNDLMRYIPKDFKKDVQNIRTGSKEWDEVTKHWATTVIVTWCDGEENEYANKTFMWSKLKDFGR